MKNLIKFELRKILTKRFAVISVAAVLLLSLILSFSTLHSMYAFDGNGAEETGKAAVEIDKQIALKYEGKLTDNKVQQMMSEFKPTQDLHGMNAKYIYQNALQSSVFSHFADIDGNWNGLSVADVFGDKEIKVGYVNGWLSTSQNMAKIFIVLSLVIILLIAPVFSGEYGGVDNMCHGKSVSKFTFSRFHNDFGCYFQFAYCGCYLWNRGAGLLYPFCSNRFFRRVYSV